MLQARYLESLPCHVHKYAGSLNIFGLVELGDFLAFFKSFREGIRKRFGSGVKFRPVTEVGPDARRLHIHYAMTSDVEVTKDDVESAWQEACDGHRVRVVHGPMRDVVAWSRYMFKSDWKYHDPRNRDCVVLFAKGSPKLPQATPGFFPGEVKAALWAEWKAQQDERNASGKSKEVTRKDEATQQGKPSGRVRFYYGETPSTQQNNAIIYRCRNDRKPWQLRGLRVDRRRFIPRERVRRIHRTFERRLEACPVHLARPP